jgi:hypothetical protein
MPTKPLQGPRRKPRTDAQRNRERIRGCGNGSSRALAREAPTKGSATDRLHLNHRAHLDSTKVRASTYVGDKVVYQALSVLIRFSRVRFRFRVATNRGAS